MIDVDRSGGRSKVLRFKSEGKAQTVPLCVVWGEGEEGLGDWGTGGLGGLVVNEVPGWVCVGGGEEEERRGEEE